MSKQKILLTETHHGGILVAFYKSLMDACGRQQGLDTFMTAARAYGERRGRRMAMRAVRDGNPLDMASYFAYGEMLFNSEGLSDPGTYEVTPGTVHERQTDCWWAREFRAMGCLECGVDYCLEIDNSVIRGFNPTLGFARTQNMHLNSSCDFYYYGPEVAEGFMETYGSRVKPGEKVKYELAFHCADVYDMFCRVIGQILPEKKGAVMEAARAILAQRYGEEFFAALEAYQDRNFDEI